MAAQSPPGTQAVRRAIMVLRAFRDGRSEWTLTELADALCLNKSTLHRLLAVLEAGGLVSRDDATGAYRLGPEVIVLGAQALRSNDLRTVSRAELVTLARRAQESATLEVLVDRDVVILDEALGPHVLAPGGEIGTRWPAHATATGKVLLASQERGRRAGRGRLAALTPRTITTAKRLESELALVRKRGYATAVDELEVGFVGVGAPIRKHGAEVVAAIGIGGPVSRMSAAKLDMLGDLVRDAADRISGRLGWQGPS
ncbi:MAG: IclR family transcriptional regulator [Longimicrobiales bacterium]